MVRGLHNGLTGLCWINQGYFTIYPNMYIVLVGAPGDRKTTSMVMSSDILRAVGGIPFAADCMTKEAVCKYMATQCQKEFVIPGTDRKKQYTPLTFCLTELTHFLGSHNSAHMIDFLVTIFDREVYETKTKHQGDDVILGPFLNILACTTPAAVTRYLKEDVITGGFSRRALFVYEFQLGDPVSWPEVTPEAAKALDSCIEWGKDLQSIAGEFQVEPSFKPWYKKWYDELFEQLRNPGENMTRGYFRSKHIQAFKVAMMLALAESRELVLKISHFETALAMLDKLEVNLPKVYEGMGRNVLASVASKMVSLLEMAGEPIPEKKILSEMFRDADTKELYGVIAHLTNTGKLVYIEEKDRTGQVIRRSLTTPSIGQAWVEKKQRETVASVPAA